MKQGSETNLRLCWLGHPLVEHSGSQVRLETRKTTALLAYLSMSLHRQAREKLAALFWPDFDPSRAPANLRRSLASLHASLPGDWLEAERDTIGLRSDANLSVDILTARSLLNELKAHSHPPQEACQDCLGRAQSAIRLFRGEFLEGFNLPDCPDFDNWQTEQRESSRLELGALLEFAARGHAEAGSWEEALRAARRWVSLDRMHEPAQLLLMGTLARAGQRSAAIRQYEEFAQTLSDEFGQVPDEETRELYNRILSREVGPSPKREKPRPEGPRRKGPGREEKPSLSPQDAVSGLLGTKLSVPPARQTLVKRSRLIRLLEEGLSTGLVVVSAPAGFGKTTILSRLAAETKLPFAWLSLDEGDNDSRRFLLHLAASLERSNDGGTELAAQMLQSMQPIPAELVVTSLINTIQEHATKTVLVLDDCQLIRSPEVHNALRFLIEHKPPSLAVVIATRADPPIPLARLRSQGRVAEVRAEDLRFTEEETEEFFRETMALSLTKEEITSLERRTEGWAAGLQMAALSLQGREDVSDFIATFGGTHRFIMDYLAEEVLSRQENEVTEFLLDTSILKRMSVGLCEAVTGRRGCAEILDRLEQMNLFLVPLDEHRNWYRYHQLFSDLLRHKLVQKRGAEQERVLHVKAGDWFAQAGELFEAIQEYLAAEAFEKAADLIETHHFDIISKGGLDQLQRWCSSIPAEMRDERPGFAVAAAWAMTWGGRQEEAELELERAERCIAAETRRPGTASPESGSPHLAQIEGNIAAARALLSDMAGDASRAIELAHVARRLVPPEDLPTTSLILYLIEKNHYYRGELAEAEAGCEELLRVVYTMGSIFSISASVCELVRLRGLQGRRREALELLEEFDALTARRHFRGNGVVAKACAIRAEYLRERGDLDEALRLAEQAARVVDAWGMPSDVFITHQFLARVLRSCGRPREALEELDRIGSLPKHSLVWAMLLPSFEADRVMTLLALGDLAAAEAWAREHEPGRAPSPINREIELATLARIRIASSGDASDLAETARLLDELVDSARSGGRGGPLVSLLVLQARALDAASRPDEALAALDEALQRGHPEGFRRVFIEEGVQVASLLRRGREAGMWGTSPLGPFVSSLLDAFPSPDRPTVAS